MCDVIYLTHVDMDENFFECVPDNAINSFGVNFGLSNYNCLQYNATCTYGITDADDNAVSIMTEMLQCPLDDPGKLVYYSTI